MSRNDARGCASPSPACRPRQRRSPRYRSRLDEKQRADIELWRKHVESLERLLDQPAYADVAARMGIRERLTYAIAEKARIGSAAYRQSLVGTLGVQPLAS